MLIKHKFKYGDVNAKILISHNEAEKYCFRLRTSLSKWIYDDMEIVLSRDDLYELNSKIESRPIGRFKIGKYRGINRQYLLFERKFENSPINIVINHWFFFFGTSFGVSIYKEDADIIHELLNSEF